MEIIVPAAGLSTRFPGHRPKYLLYDYKSDLMLKNAVAPFIGNNNITVGILKEHQKKYNAKSHINNAVPDARVIELSPTKGPADTVYIILTTIGQDVSFLVKDCDSFFEFPDYYHGNFICVSRIQDHETLTRLSAKSFVRYNNQGIVTDIVEKQVVSDTFCVGGYAFASSHAFIKSYEKISKNATGEIYVSHIIQDMILNGTTFATCPVTNYVDAGTSEDWHKYNDKPVIFCDIDGTLIVAQSRYGDYNYGSKPIVLSDNYNKIKHYYDNGAQIIFTTAREEVYYDQTKHMLEEMGFGDCLLIMGLNNSARILINDYNEANPYPRALAYNIRRDSDTLKDIMK